MCLSPFRDGFETACSELVAVRLVAVPGLIQAQNREERDVIAGGINVMDPITHQPHANDQRTNSVDEALNQIRESLRGLRFGSVNIIVQDGVIIQIDRTEKHRLRTEPRK
jgi:hypothetical protein